MMHRSNHFPRHFAAKSTSKQAIRTINPISSTVSDIGHFLGLRSNIFSPSHTENHSTAGTISNNHHKDISTPGFLWSDNTVSTGGPARDVGTIAGPVLSDPSVPAIVISEVGGSATPANAALIFSVTSRGSDAAPIRARAA